MGMSLALMPHDESSGDDMDITKRIQAVLRHEESERNISWKAVAAKTNIPYNTLLRYVHGSKDIPLRALRAICLALGLQVSEVVQVAESGQITLRAEWEPEVHENPNPLQMSMSNVLFPRERYLKLLHT